MTPLPIPSDPTIWPENSTKVDLTVALDAASLEFRVRMTPAEALAVAALLPDAGVAPDVFANLIRECNNAIPRGQYGRTDGTTDNPNNGKPNHTFFIGRENSRVVYISWPTAYAQAGFNPVHLRIALMGIASQAGAEEIDDQSSQHEILIRIWWD